MKRRVPWILGLLAVLCLLGIFLVARRSTNSTDIRSNPINTGSEDKKTFLDDKWYVYGRITDEQGIPINKAAIAFIDNKFANTKIFVSLIDAYTLGESETDSRGMFAIELKQESEGILRVRHSEFCTTYSAMTKASQYDRTPLVGISLTKGCKVTGRIMLFEKEKGDWLVVARPIPVTNTSGDFRVARVNNDGSFEFKERFLPGRYGFTSGKEIKPPEPNPPLPVTRPNALEILIGPNERLRDVRIKQEN